jgi:hypothetical protein
VSKVYTEKRTIAQLLFADDMADTADTVILIRRQIDVLSDFAKKYAMKVNMQKSKIMVFRKGGPLRTQEVWYLGGQKIETTSKYKYLVVQSIYEFWGVNPEQIATKVVLLEFSLDIHVYPEQPKKSIPIDSG